MTIARELDIAMKLKRSAKNKTNTADICYVMWKIISVEFSDTKQWLVGDVPSPYTYSFDS